jgi:hypothetical protein
MEVGRSTGGCAPGGVIARVLRRILAPTAAIRHGDRTGRSVLRSSPAYGHRPLGMTRPGVQTHPGGQHGAAEAAEPGVGDLDGLRGPRTEGAPARPQVRMAGREGGGLLAPAVDRSPCRHTPRWSTRRSGPRASMRSPTASSVPPSSPHRRRAAGRRGRHRSRRPSPRCLSCRSRHLPRRGDRVRRSTFGPGRRAGARVPARPSRHGPARTPAVPLRPAPSGLRSRSG